MRRGEVWLINLDPTIGAEIKKIRPAVIVNDDAIGILPLKVIVPITEWKDQYSIAPWMVMLEATAKSGLEKTSAADAFQVRSVAQQRFDRQIGKLTEEDLEKITKALAIVLTIELQMDLFRETGYPFLGFKGGNMQEIDNSIRSIEVSYNTQPLSTLNDTFKSLNLNPAFQRKSVWAITDR